MTRNGPADKAGLQVAQARQQVAGGLRCLPQEVFFTSGATEADNLALFGVLRQRPPGGAHLITTAVEHHAVLHAAQQLDRAGYAVTVLPVDGQGVVDPDDVRKALRPETVLVSVMLVNNEVGSIQPVGEIAAGRGHGLREGRGQRFERLLVEQVQDEIADRARTEHRELDPAGDLLGVALRHGDLEGLAPTIREADALAVQERALAPDGGEKLVEHRLIDHAHREFAVGVGHRDADAEERKGVNEVQRAVERIDNPGAPRRPLAARPLLAEQSVIGKRLGDGRRNHRLALLIDFGDEILELLGDNLPLGKFAES
jgi:hypothetical protein